MRRRQRWGEVRVFKTAKESIHNNEDLENRRFPLKLRGRPASMILWS